MPKEKTDEEFAHDFYATLQDVDLVGTTATIAGIIVDVPHLRVRGDSDKSRHYHDGGIDMWLNGWRVSLKWRDLKFTCPEDYPHDTIIIDEEGKYNRLKHKPHVLICTNRDRTAAIVVTLSHRKVWGREEMVDRKRNRPIVFLHAPKSEMMTLVAYLTILQGCRLGDDMPMLEAHKYLWEGEDR